MKNIPGVSLIEVLISLFLLSVILLSVDAMEVSALRKTKAAYFFTVATIQIHSMSEQLYALKNNSGLSEALLHWNQQNQELLPQGEGKISGHFPFYKLILYWGNWNKKNCAKTLFDEGGCIEEEVAL